MAADCKHREHSNQQDECPIEVEVDPAIWKACAGTSFRIPDVQARVYYFPQGHIEHYSDLKSVLSNVPHLRPMPYVLCRVVQVLYLVDSDSDEVYAKIRLKPCDESLVLSQSSPSSVSSDDGVVVSYAKVLTPSDANNGGGFSVPRFCADSVFPPLDYYADPPVQTLSITDLLGQTWNFRHIYRGTPRRHLLTTGWSKYVNSKMLVSGDSVVFMKNKVTGKLFLGVRKAKESSSSADLKRWALLYGSGTLSGEGSKKGKVPPESVAKALELAADNKQFEVVYYPKAGSQDFVVDAEKVEVATNLPWSPGIRVKMAQETEDSSRMTWLEGTVSSVLLPASGTWECPPWKMLQVTWDEPEALENMKKVSPWQVEFVPMLSMDPAFPLAKKLRLPQNCGFSTNREAADFPSLPHNMSFSNTMIGQRSSSYMNYNKFPAGMQGARQSTSRVSSSANLVSDTYPSFPVAYADNNNLLQRTADVATDLNIGSSPSDVVSPASSSSIVSSSPDIRTSAREMGRTSIQLFGQTIHVASPKHAENVGNGENQRLRNPLDDDDKVDVPCSTVEGFFFTNWK